MILSATKPSAYVMLADERLKYICIAKGFATALPGNLQENNKVKKATHFEQICSKWGLKT